MVINDVIIIGSGLSAQVMYKALVHLTTRIQNCHQIKIKSPLKVMICQMGMMNSRKTSNYPTRYYNINKSSLEYLKNIGILINENEICPINNIVINDYRSKAFVNFQTNHQNLSSNHDSNHICYMIKEQSILSQCQIKSNDIIDLSYYKGHPLTFIGKSDSKHCYSTLVLNNGQKLHSRLFIIADGSESLIAQQVFDFESFNKFEYDFKQSAIVATLKHLNPRKQDKTFYWQKFLPQGPLAILPIKDPLESSMVWCVDHDQCYEIMKLPKSQFISRINHEILKMNYLSQYLDSSIQASNLVKEKFLNPSYDLDEEEKYFLPEVVVDYDPNTLIKFDLKLKIRTKFISDNLVLIGDAIHKIHPMAGQGFNLALSSIKTLCEQLEECLTLGFGLEEQFFLQKYQSNHLKSKLIKLISNPLILFAFTSQNNIISTLRSLGMATLQNIDDLKKCAMNIQDKI